MFSCVKFDIDILFNSWKIGLMVQSSITEFMKNFSEKKICPKFDSFLLSFLQWLNEKQIVEKLIACLVPTQDEDVSSKINSIVFLFLYHSFVTFLLLTIL